MSVQRSQLILSNSSLQELLFSSVWDPQKGFYGFFRDCRYVYRHLSPYHRHPLSVLCSIYIPSATKRIKPPSSLSSMYWRVSLVVCGFALFGAVPLWDTLVPPFREDNRHVRIYGGTGFSGDGHPVMISISVESSALYWLGNNFCIGGYEAAVGGKSGSCRSGYYFRVILGFQGIRETMAVMMVIETRISSPPPFVSGPDITGAC